MESLAWVLILAAALIGRQVTVGRAANLREDTHDFFLAAFRGEGSKLSEVAKRRGKTRAQSAADASATGPVLNEGQPVSVTGTNTGNALIREMKRLAGIANNRYRWGGVGPDGYDCSGLVWRAMKNLGFYNGPRFTASMFGPAMVASKKADRVSTPQPGDVVVWPLRHMGVVVGPDRMYSALSTKLGIVESAISYESGTPIYWRLREDAGYGDRK